MDSLLGFAPTDTSSSPSQFRFNSLEFKYSLDVSIIATLSDDETTNGVDFSQGYKSLSVSAQEIIKKINDLLKTSLPAGVESLKPEEVTPEATAERIVSSVTAFFPAFAKQNPELSPEEQLDKFMEEVKRGVQQGYDEAFDILEGLGAFNFEGVQEGVEQTKILIDSKLTAFYNLKRKELGLDSDTEAAKTPEAKGFLESDGVSQLNVVA